MRPTRVALVLMIGATALGLVGAVGTAGGCGKKPAPVVVPVAKPVVTAPARPAPPPKLTGDQTVRMEADFAKARLIVKEADVLREEGRQIARTKGQEGANDVWVKAKHKYQNAVTMTERWVEGELHEVTDAQVKAYLGVWVETRGAWIKSMSELGKLHE